MPIPARPTPTLSPEQADFTHALRVYWEDTDAGGIVYYANYLRYFERARSEWLLRLAIDQNLLAQEGLLFVVKAVALDYRRPARLLDALQITVQLQSFGKASLDLQQGAWRGEELLVSGSVRVAALSRQTGRPIAMPAQLLERLRA